MEYKLEASILSLFKFIVLYTNSFMNEILVTARKQNPVNTVETSLTQKLKLHVSLRNFLTFCK